MSPGAVNCPVVVNVPAWNKLPAQYQALLKDAKVPAYDALISAYETADAKNLPMMEKQGLIAIKYSDAELAAFRKAGAQPVWDDWLKSMEEQKLPGKELLDLIMTTANQ